MHSESFTLRADDGVEVFVRHWRPAAGRSNRGVVQIAHGMAEHGGRYARFAKRLVERGWAVLASDHRGHGSTVNGASTVGHFADEDGWTRVLHDLRMVRERARSEHPDVPFVLMGHSMGSFLAQSWALSRPREMDALVLSGTNAGGGALVGLGQGIAALERLRLGRRGKSDVIREMTFGRYNAPFEGRTKYDWLSRDPSEVDKYASDPLCGFKCTNQLWVDLLGALDQLGRADWRSVPGSLPILLFAGERDPVGDNGRGVRRLGKLMRDAGLHITERIYPEARHETLNEVNRDEVMRDVEQWLEAHVPNPGRGS